MNMKPWHIVLLTVAGIIVILATLAAIQIATKKKAGTANIPLVGAPQIEYTIPETTNGYF